MGTGATGWLVGHGAGRHASGVVSFCPRTESGVGRKSILAHGVEDP